MDDFETILKRVPADRQDAVLAWYNNLPDAHKARGLQDLAAKYPGLPSAPSVGAQTVVQGIRPVQLSPAQSLMAGAAQGLMLGGADEMAGVSSASHGQNYESARQLAASSLERSKAEHPILYHTGELLGGGMGLLGMEQGALAVAKELGPKFVERLLTPAVTRGISGSLTRGAVEGGALGAVSGALHASPGTRVMGALTGAPLGAAGGVAGGTFGGMFGRFAGNAEARAVRDIAEAGGVDLNAALRTAHEVSPESPVAVADVIGPVATSRVRAAALTPGPGQRMATSFFRGREAQAPGRIVGAIEDMAGSSGMNPHAAAEQLAQARSQQANELYAQAYAERPTPELAQTAKVPRVAQTVRALRNAQRQSGQTPATGPATVEELHAVRKILDDQSRSLTNMNASSADHASARLAADLRDRLDVGLKSVPGFATADNAFHEASGLMDAYDQGRTYLQTDPALAEHTLSQSTPDQRRMVLLGLPASVAKEANIASPRTLLGRLGLGQTPKFGRKVALDALTEHFPQAEDRLRQLAQEEELMLPANRAASAEATASSTVPNLVSLAEKGASNVVYPSVRGELFGVARNVLRGMASRANPEDAARDMALLTRTGPAMRSVVSDAALSQADRDVRRIVGRKVGIFAAPGLVGFGVSDEGGRQNAAQDYFTQLRQQGATEESARQLAQTRYGVTLP